MTPFRMNMNTEFLTITGVPDQDRPVMEKAAEVIRQGGLVAIPTETVYGLAGSALLEESAHRIYEAKGRPSDNPLIVHIAGPEDAEKIAYPTEAFDRLARTFMPGPLTVVLPKRKNIPDAVTGGLPTVAVRCPSNPVAHRLIEISGHPIAAPSANRSGFPSPTTAQHVLQDLDGRIDMILDGGPCEIGLESTVVRLDGDECTVLRPGAVTVEMLSSVCRSVRVAEAVLSPELAGEGTPESPGMKYKHYAPRAKVILVDASDKAFAGYILEHASGNYGLLVSNEEAGQLPPGGKMLLTGPRGDAREACRRLFSLLRKADELGLDCVYAQLPPTDGEYLAYYNRIIRAAGSEIVRP